MAPFAIADVCSGRHGLDHISAFQHSDTIWMGLAEIGSCSSWFGSTQLCLILKGGRYLCSSGDVLTMSQASSHLSSSP